MVALGLASLGVAVVLLLAEAHLSTGGVIAVVAAVALVGGVALLLVGAAAGLLAVLAVSGAVCVVSVGALVLLVRSLGPARLLRPRSGKPAMVGHLGVMRASDPNSMVFVDGGLWRAQPSPLDAENVLHDGDRVVVDHVKGLTLYVRKAEELELYS
ncbi:MAG: NfeD family protein [Solirubrobacteraceae bacterium]